MPESVVIVETPRDAFQGLPRQIPTEEKVRYVRAVLDAGFRHVDCGSFVHPKIVPQMADTRAVVEAVRGRKDVEYIALVANEQGVDRAIECGGLDTLGFPFSFSNEFQMRNTNKTVAETWPVVERMIARTEDADLSFLAYVSMAFGNPYGEPWEKERLIDFLKALRRSGVRHVALSDTTAAASPEQVKHLFQRAKAELPEIEFSAHFHGRPGDWHQNILAALEAGCRRFDGASGGMGGCPFAQDKLVANVPTEGLVELLEDHGYDTGIDADKMSACAKLAQEFQAKYS
ncbi:MAG: hydroxymethylglutaryl-CoA lyase [Planctomycetota bacterium]|nr:hydroxymethylglutaryl-CoA lyase [Planctomycetota bacterium]